MFQIRHSRVVAIAGLLLASAALGQTPGAAPSVPAPTRLAVVNIIEVFNKLDEKIQVDQNIQKMNQDYTDQVRAKKKELEDLEKELDDPSLVAKGSAAYRKEQDDYLEKTIDLQAFTQKVQQKVFMEQRLQTMLIYRKMVSAIEAYSQARGIAIVFAIDDVDIISAARSAQELSSLISIRKVVYATPSWDITKDIVGKMNTEFHIAPAKGTP